MDSQASGWDKDFMTQNWTSTQAQLKTFWSQSYTCASRCNDFLAGLEKATTISADVKKHLKGEALALRGFEFFGLANTFGRVPLLITGETYLTNPTKPKASSFEEMWDFVIKDFKEAAELLDWKPFQGQYGRCTKGMALTFLGDAYMWKAYTVPEKAKECYQKAYDAFKEVINSGEYELSPSFTALYDAAEAWPKECIWQVLLNTGDNYGSWDASQTANAKGWTGFYFGPTSNGAWGTYQMSWELYDDFENYLDGTYAGSFDKRRDGSMVTATVPYEMWKEHPILMRLLTTSLTRLPMMPMQSLLRATTVSMTPSTPLASTPSTRSLLVGVVTTGRLQTPLLQFGLPSTGVTVVVVTGLQVTSGCPTTSTSSVMLTYCSTRLSAASTLARMLRVGR